MKMLKGLAANAAFAVQAQSNETKTVEAVFYAARYDFWCFVELMFPVLHPGKKLIFASYLELLATVLMSVEQGNLRRVLLNLPPRHMKSMLTSVLYPAWILGRNPSAKFICISYSDDLAHNLSTLTRSVLRSALYCKVFPQTRLQKSAEDHIRTTQGGYRYATAVGSTITGFGADVIIVDDPLQPEDATSESAKMHFRSWLNSSVMTRFNNPSTGALILVMHRLSFDDPSADMTPLADFELCLPLVAEVEEIYEFNDKVIHARKVGEALNPTLYSAADIEKLRQATPPHIFAAQYQQRPTTGGGGMYNVASWPRYDALPPFELYLQSWDIGATVSGNASVCTTWGLRKNAQGRDAVYLTDVKRLKRELPEVVAAIKAADQQYKPGMIAMDERGVGLGAYQALRREGFNHLYGATLTADIVEYEGPPVSRPSVSKIDRFGQAILAISDQRVLIPKHAPWLESFLAEVAGFPNIPDKDQVDSMTQIVGNLERVIYLARHHHARR